MKKMIKRTVMLLTLCALLIASFSGCFYVHEDILPRATALEIKQAIYNADDPADRVLYRPEDITFRYCANFNGTYVVLANEMFYSGFGLARSDEVDNKMFYQSTYYIFTVFREGKLYDLQTAYDNGWLTSAQLQKVSEKLDKINEEDEISLQNEWDLRVNDPGTLSAEKALEIRKAFLEMHGWEDGYLALDEISIAYYGKFGDCYVVYYGGFAHFPAHFRDIIHGVQFDYGTSITLTAYHDGKFYNLRQAFEKGLLSVEDLEAIKTYRVVKN